MISIQMTGEREARGFFSKLPGKINVAKREIELDIAKEVAAGTRANISQRFKQKDGRMLESVRLHKFGLHWGVIAGGATAPYFPVQEFGKDIMGWSFIPDPTGRSGKYGEGHSVKGGMIRIKGRRPMTDAIVLARKNAVNTARKRLRRIGGKV